MPLFHFDVRYNGEGWSEDDMGLEFERLDEARAAALDLIAAIAKEDLRKYDTLAVRVRDGQPEPVLTLSLSLLTEERA